MPTWAPIATGDALLDLAYLQMIVTTANGKLTAAGFSTIAVPTATDIVQRATFWTPIQSAVSGLAGHTYPDFASARAAAGLPLTRLYNNGSPRFQDTTEAHRAAAFDNFAWRCRRPRELDPFVSGFSGQPGISPLTAVRDRFGNPAVAGQVAWLMPRSDVNSFPRVGPYLCDGTVWNLRPDLSPDIVDNTLPPPDCINQSGTGVGPGDYIQSHILQELWAVLDVL